MKNLKNVIIFSIILSTMLSCPKENDFNQRIDLPEITPGLRDTLENYLVEHYMNPEDYVVNMFTDHDIVFTGEYHRIKHDLALIHNLIPRLYENGIFTLGIEFARREDQSLIDSLLKGITYDESLAQRILFNFMPTWGYQEYADIYKVVWQLNNTIPEGSRRFHVLGLNGSLDWSIVKTPDDMNNPSIMQQVWKDNGEDLWAKVIMDSVVAKGEKALIYSGIHHAFTEYKQPIYDDSKMVFTGYNTARMGNYIFNKIGKKAVTICLHFPWYSEKGYIESYVYPADGIIDAVMAKITSDYRQAGFDTKNTPFGKLTGETSVYKYGYNNFTLDIFCDGYIFQMPLSAYNGVTAIEDFINETNIEQARIQEPYLRNASIEEFNRVIKEAADIKKRFATFW
jgi:hypothetical protein